MRCGSRSPSPVSQNARRGLPKSAQTGGISHLRKILPAIESEATSIHVGVRRQAKPNLAPLFWRFGVLAVNPLGFQAWEYASVDFEMRIATFPLPVSQNARRGLPPRAPKPTRNPKPLRNFAADRESEAAKYPRRSDAKRNLISLPLFSGGLAVNPRPSVGILRAPRGARHYVDRDRPLSPLSQPETDWKRPEHLQVLRAALDGFERGHDLAFGDVAADLLRKTRSSRFRAEPAANAAF